MLSVLLPLSLASYEIDCTHVVSFQKVLALEEQLLDNLLFTRSMNMHSFFTQFILLPFSFCFLLMHFASSALFCFHCPLRQHSSEE